MDKSGIYIIKSKTKPERCYIGSAVNLNKRRQGHFWGLNTNKHSNKKLQHHYNKYGSEDMFFEALYLCSRTELIQTEQVFINTFNPYFNICKVAGSSLGVIRSAESRLKMRTAKLGTTQTEDVVRKRMANSRGENHPYYGKFGIDSIHYGRKRSKETCRKISESLKGKYVSEETKQRLRVVRLGAKTAPEITQKMSQMFTGEGNPFHGKTHSDEAKQKMRNAKLGKKRSKESVEKQRAATTGSKRSDEAKQKIRAARVGRNNGIVGKHHGMARAILDLTTGIDYGCVKEAAEMLGVSTVTVNAWLQGKGSRKNEFKYV